jgi:SAM-dependent methyltransferase
MSPAGNQTKLDEALFQDFVRQHGEWTAHPIRLSESLATIQGAVNTNHLLYLQRVVQATADIVRRPFSELRVLDLGALEGGFSIEFAKRGAKCLAVEGRKRHCDKIAFVRDALNLANLEVLNADVRQLDPQALGSFDIVLCLGLFYHIDAKSIVKFARSLYALTRSVCVVDTHIALFARTKIEADGRTYHGDLYREHRPEATQDEIEAKRWASIEREASFFMTEPSLCNLLDDVGFSSVMTCQNPYYKTMFDRKTYLAIRSEKIDTLASYPMPQGVQSRHPEQKDLAVVEPINKLPAVGIF